MTYQPNKPLPTDFLSDSQLDIRNNFTVANTVFGKNHIDFTTVTNTGKHKFVEMPNQAVLPLGLVASEGTLYTKAVTAVSQMFYTPDASANEYQMTRTISASFTLFGTITANYNPGSGAVGAAYSAGWTFLPGGLILQYGFTTAVTSSASTTVKFPVPFSAVPFSVQLTVQTDDSSTVRLSLLGTPTATQFVTTQTSTSHFTRLYWIAIGK